MFNPENFWENVKKKKGQPNIKGKIRYTKTQKKNNTEEKHLWKKDDWEQENSTGVK